MKAINNYLQEAIITQSIDDSDIAYQNITVDLINNIKDGEVYKYGNVKLSIDSSYNSPGEYTQNLTKIPLSNKNKLVDALNRLINEIDIPIEFKLYILYGSIGVFIYFDYTDTDTIKEWICIGTKERKVCFISRRTDDIKRNTMSDEEIRTIANWIN